MPTLQQQCQEPPAPRVPPPPPLLTSRALLNLCSLTTTSSTNDDDDKQKRLEILHGWHERQSPLLASLLFDRTGSGGGAAVDSNTGCFPLHWAAGTGFNEAVSFLLDHYSNDYYNYAAAASAAALLFVNQWAIKPSTGRTPLHYAARNGHLSTCRLLIEVYQADPNPHCHRGSVTPLQLSVWQNRLEIVQYLVLHNNNNNNATNNVVLERNDFHCGLNHWIGLVPRHRWNNNNDGDNHHNDSDGSGVLPLARHLHQQGGLSYTSTPDNRQNQGHTPLHKAAWGGNIALMQYYRQEHDVYDDLQDACGNYAADLARMAGHVDAQAWLHHHGSRSRHASCRVLGLPVTATRDEIQTRYKTLARIHHPDKKEQQQLLPKIAAEAQQQQQPQLNQHWAEEIHSLDDDDDDNKNDDNTKDVFVRIKAAYEHLIHQGGVGNQKNPKYEALRLLTCAKALEGNAKMDKATTKKHRQVDDDHNIDADADVQNNNGDSASHVVETTSDIKQDNNNNNDDDDDDDLFHARILTIISDYGDKGFPISAIAKRWNQIWPDRPFPTPEHYIIEVPAIVDKKTTSQADAATDAVAKDDTLSLPPPTTMTTTMVPKRVRLLRFLKWKCSNVVAFRKVNGVELAFQRKQQLVLPPGGNTGL